VSLGASGFLDTGRSASFTCARDDGKRRALAQRGCYLVRRVRVHPRAFAEDEVDICVRQTTPWCLDGVQEGFRLGVGCEVEKALAAQGLWLT